MSKNNHCKVCGKIFTKYKTTQSVCSYECSKIKNKSKTKKSAVKSKKEYFGKNDLEVVGEVDLFDIIWEQAEGKSFLTGKHVRIRQYSPLYYNCFAHVLAKGMAKYPNFRLYSKNIILLSPEEHSLLDAGSADKRFEYGIANNCKWTDIYKLKDELILEYLNEFPNK